MKEFFTRTISGFLFIFVIISSLLAHELSFLILFTLILVFSFHEFYDLMYKLKFHPYKPAFMVAGGILFLVNYFIAGRILKPEFLYLNLMALALSPVFPLFYSPRTFSQSWLSSLSGWIYILLPFSLLPFIVFRDGDYNPYILLGIFVIIWVNDSFAYVFGSLLGKHKMFPSISPKKSWEGFAGGLIITLAASFFLKYLPGTSTSADWIILSLIVVVTGTTGDFIESAIKRSAGVKDSGVMMPGHGGFLDRFDSFIFSVTFVFLYLEIFQ